MVANGGDENAISELNAALVPVYGRLLEDGKATDLIGKDLDLTLVLKYASDRHLLFSDTQIIVDRDTKYYLIKWKFRKSDVEDVIGKSNVKCRVRGTIVDVIKGATSPRMPYIVVELVTIEI